MNREKRIMAAKRFLVLARQLMAEGQGEEGEGDVQDEQFAARIRNLRTKMNKLGQKKRRKLNQYGITMLRPSDTVEDLVAALEMVLAEA
jgi:hypothetical protein